MKRKILGMLICILFFGASFSSIISAETIDNIQQENQKIRNNSAYLITTSNSKTKFEPPYESDPYINYDANVLFGDAYAAANKETGYIGGSINLSGLGMSIPAAGLAEAYQVLDFYIGDQKSLHVDAEIVVSVMDIDILFALSETYAIAICDGEQVYSEEIEPLIGLDEWLDIIFMVFGFVGDIGMIISAIATINELLVFWNYMMDLEDYGVTITADLSFDLPNLNAGNHELKIGCKELAMCPTGLTLQKSSFLGGVHHITVDGLAPPEKPTITGPDYAGPNENCEFCATSVDPNNDDVQYKFSWGDGQESSWSSLISSGEEFCLTHSYSDNGEYDIKVKSKDSDLYESEWSDAHTISIADRAADLNCEGALGWTNVVPGATVTGQFLLQNIGESNSKLDWQISDYPDWGVWTFEPSSGTDLTPEDEDIYVQVTVEAPNEQLEAYEGYVKIVNQEDATDYEEIGSILVTPRNRQKKYQLLNQFLLKLSEHFNLIKILNFLNFS